MRRSLMIGGGVAFATLSAAQASAQASRQAYPPVAEPVSGPYPKPPAAKSAGPIKPGRGTALMDKVAVVTGAARGIGRAIAVEFAANGADVIAIDIAGPISPTADAIPATPTELSETVDQIERFGRRGTAIQADIRDIDTLRRIADQVVREHGKIDIVVANAAIQGWKPLLEMDDMDWGDQIENNLTGTANTVRAFAPKMVARGYGRLILLSSMQGKMGTMNGASYSASKWGILGLMKSAALELGQHNITCNAILPGLIGTPLTYNEQRFRAAIAQSNRTPSENPTAQEDLGCARADGAARCRLVAAGGCFSCRRLLGVRRRRACHGRRVRCDRRRRRQGQLRSNHGARPILPIRSAAIRPANEARSQHHHLSRRKRMVDGVPMVHTPAEMRPHVFFSAPDRLAFASRDHVLRADGDFFQFDLHEAWHHADLVLPATDKHLIRILLDSSVQCEFSCGTSRHVGRMTTGDIALVPAACEGRWRWSGLNQTSMDVRICKDWLARQMWDEPGAACARIELIPVTCRNDPFILQIGLALVEEMRAPLAASRKFAAESAALLLGRHLQRRYARHVPVNADPKCGGLAGWQLRRVKAAMEAAETSLSLEALATMVGLSPAHFCTAFRQSTGLPPRRWQMRLRTERAKTLLADPRLSLTEIALACGYASSSHFATSFRRATGMTPSMSRRR